VATAGVAETHKAGVIAVTSGMKAMGKDAEMSGARAMGVVAEIRRATAIGVVAESSGTRPMDVDPAEMTVSAQPRWVGTSERWAPA
jgi:hypothetical protein